MFVKEEDWRLFRKRLPLWQNAYIKRLNSEYMEILKGNEDEAEKFWRLEQRIREDRKSSGVCIRMSRSNLWLNLVLLVREQIIGIDDLEGFSEELVQTIKHATSDDI